MKKRTVWYGALGAIFLLLTGVVATAQEKPVRLNGYLKYLGMYYQPDFPLPGFDSRHLSSHLLHNRLNFSWYASENLTLTVEGRNRLLFGKLVKDYPGYRKMTDSDPGFFDLSATLASGNGWFFLSNIDRAYLDFSKGKWQIRAGRQRINWGINLVWNPNDIFNTFDYFDFDYEERPGTDALKVQYYTGATSSGELVFKPGRHSGETALAGLYRFSQWDYDFQFLGGVTGPDLVVGSGWSGDIRGGGFRGEVSWFIPRQARHDSYQALVASLSGDYSFSKGLYLHGGFLFNSHGTTGPAGGRLLFDQQLSAKMLSLARWSLFGQCSYPVTPLFNAALSGIVNPGDHSFYIGPSLTYSLGNNLEVMLTGQLFSGDTGTEFGDYGKLLFARLKWAF